jgi:Ni2+-binding GTPase involved in maturation of urease and hydrogenase
MFDIQDFQSSPSSIQMENPLPITILTGFLGSGKSTFLNALFKDPDFQKTLVIVNEFGEIGLDHLLIERPEENIVLLEGGCLCCEVRGDLVQTLGDIHRRRRSGDLAEFNRIVIETTGLSNPVPIIQSILCDIELSPHYALCKIITIVDSREIESQVTKFTEAIEQVAVADLLLVSKTDLVDHLPMDRLESILRPINPGSPIVINNRGILSNFNLNEFLQADANAEHDAFLHWLERGEHFILTNQSSQTHRSNEHSALHPMHGKGISLFSESNRIHTFSLRREGVITGNSFVVWLNLLATMKGENLLRLKAILNVEGMPVALHGTHTIIHEPIEISEWPSADRSSRFVVIANGPIQKYFERSLELLDFNVQTHSEVALINPDSYQNFLKLAESFSRV